MEAAVAFWFSIGQSWIAGRRSPVLSTFAAGWIRLDSGLSDPNRGRRLFVAISIPIDSLSRNAIPVCDHWRLLDRSTCDRNLPSARLADSL